MGYGGAVVSHECREKSPNFALSDAAKVYIVLGEKSSEFPEFPLVAAQGMLGIIANVSEVAKIAGCCRAKC